MKKLILSAAALLALGLGVFAACTPEEGPDTGDPSNPPEPTPPTPTEFDFGDYANTDWVSTEGVLDLTEGTYSADPSFAVTGVEGQFEDIVISCTMDGGAYTLRYNDYEGRLDLYDAQGAAAGFFLADVSPFAGTWYNADNGSVYYSISSVPDDEGYFSFKTNTVGSVNSHAASRMNSVFMFNEDEDHTAGVFLAVPDLGVTVTYSSSGLYLGSTEEDATGETLTPYGSVYSENYRASSGEELGIDFETNAVTFRGETTECTLAAGLSGSGIYFRIGGTEYGLIVMPEATYLCTGSQKTVFASYDTAWLTGSEEGESEWSSAGNLYRLSFEENTVEMDGTAYELTTALEDGATVYRFAVGTGDAAITYTIRPVLGSRDVLELDTADLRRGGYYFRNTLMQTFVKTYDSNSEVLTVTVDDGGVNVSSYLRETGETNNFSAAFTYLPDLGSVAVSYTPYGTIGSTFYLTQMNSLGIYWTIVGSEGSYASVSSYFTEEFLPTAWEMLFATLSGEDDFYTTGDAQPTTFVFDREAGTVTLDGDTYYFTWGYGYITESSTAPELYISVSNEPSDVSQTTYEYWRYTAIPRGLGLDVQYAEIRVEGGAAEYVGDPYWFFCAPESSLAQLREIVFAYNGAFERETVSFAQNGSLIISTVAEGASSSLLGSETIEDYALTMTTDAGGKEVITITVGEGDATYTVTINDRTYLTIGSKVYSHEDLAAMAGIYYGADGGELELTVRGGIVVGGVNATVSKIDNDTEGQLTVTYRSRGADHTAVFTASGATVDGAAYERVVSDMAAFVGVYTVGGNTIEISASAENVNSAVSLVARVNGILSSPAFSADGGVQTLTLSAFDVQAMKRISCTLVLEDGVVTATVNGETESDEKAAAEWSYADFAFTGERTVTVDGKQYKLTCVMKGDAAVFLLDGEVCADYLVAIDADGEATLTLSCGGVTFNV